MKPLSESSTTGSDAHPADEGSDRADVESIDLPPVPGGWTTRNIEVGSHWFELLLPADPDEFLNDPDVQAANRQSDYMPYWASLWSSAPLMASLIAKHDWPAGQRVLELGCGIGLAGLAALACGLHVTFSDYDPVAVQTAVTNARRNGLSACDGLVLDWTHVAATSPNRFPILLGCDVVYEAATHEPLIGVLNWLLTDDGECWIADPGRSHAAAFADRIRAAGYTVALRNEHGDVCSDQPIGSFRLLVIRRSKSHY